MKTFERITCIVAAMGLGSACSALAAQPSYPTKPVRIVNPFSPGGAVDVVARAVSQKLNESWEQSVIVDNRPGAGTRIGTDLVANASPDGYTLLFTSAVIAANVTLYPQSRDPLTVLAPVALVAQAPFVLAVNPSVPAKSVRELIALAKAKPRQITYGSAGSGTTTHLMLELFKLMADVDMLHVPYKGGAPALNALLGGEVQATFLPITIVLPQARAGRARILGVTSGKRAELAPDLPTVAESGLLGFDPVGWYAMFAPSGAPEGVINQINTEINRILRLPDVRKHFQAQGLIPSGGAPVELAEYLRMEIARWGKVIKEAKIKPQ